MYEIDSKLKKLAQDGTPIHVSLIGCGQMGKDIIAQISKMDGMVCDIVVDLSTETVLDGYRQAGYAESDIVITDDQAEAEAAIATGRKVATTSCCRPDAGRHRRHRFPRNGRPRNDGVHFL